MNSEFVEILDEIFSEECFDMCDEIPCEEMYSCIEKATFELNLGVKIVDFEVCGFLFRVHNEHRGFVSCSKEDRTSVSYTEYYPYPNDGDHDKKECYKELIDMMNEAWYSCNRHGTHHVFKS